MRYLIQFAAILLVLAVHHPSFAENQKVFECKVKVQYKFDGDKKISSKFLREFKRSKPVQKGQAHVKGHNELFMFKAGLRNGTISTRMGNRGLRRPFAGAKASTDKLITTFVGGDGRGLALGMALFEEIVGRKMKGLFEKLPMIKKLDLICSVLNKKP